MIERVDLCAGDTVGSRYRVEKKLGEGSFGEVFKVSDRNGGTAALKLLKLWAISPDDRQNTLQRFDMEYNTGRIESPYLVHSLGKGEHRGNPYIVMEYCDGGDMQRAMDRGELDIARSMTEVLYGLRALHREGKVHRDLKPENVLFRRDRTAVLTDFGISGDRNNRLTRRGILGAPKEIMGTFIYMPPEQANPPRGNATVLPTTDIFSFGVMLYQALTQELPFGKLESEADLGPYCQNGRTGRWNRKPLERHPQAAQWMPVLEGCLLPDYNKRLQTTDDVLRLMPKSSSIPHPTAYSDPRPFVGDGRWRLRVMQGEEVGRIYLLDPERLRAGVLRMGRGSTTYSNDIQITETYSSYVSRAHCTLEWDANEQRWYLWDGQWVEQTGGGYWNPSLNGTFVGSREATMDIPIPLSPGDIVAIGDVTLKVEVA